MEFAQRLEGGDGTQINVQWEAEEILLCYESLCETLSACEMPSDTQRHRLGGI